MYTLLLILASHLLTFAQDFNPEQCSEFTAKGIVISSECTDNHCISGLHFPKQGSPCLRDDLDIELHHQLIASPHEVGGFAIDLQPKQKINAAICKLKLCYQAPGVPSVFLSPKSEGQ